MITRSILRRHFHLIFATASLALYSSIPAASVAQQPFNPPDALILVQPMGNQALLSISYPGKMPHATVRDAVRRLGKLSGWKLSSSEIKDVRMKTSDRYGPPMDLGVQTGVSSIISGAPLTAKGGFVLQPFVDTFRDLKSYKILYWMSRQRDFQGLRAFGSAAISIDLIQDGGPYRYSVENHNHQGLAPRLPLTQPYNAGNPDSAATPALVQQPPAASGQVWPLLAPVAAIAVGCGLAVFIFLRIAARSRNQSRKNAASSRTSTSDSHHSYRI